MAIGKESIKRAASVNNISKQRKAVKKGQITNKMQEVTNEENNAAKKEIVSNIKSDLPIYLL